MADEGTDNQEVEQPDPQTEAGAPGGEQPTERTFTQAEVDQLVADRLKRADEARAKKMSEELGCDLKTAKAKLAEQRDAEEAQKGETQREREGREAAEKRAAEAEAKLLERDRRDAFTAAARKAKARDDALADAYAAFTRDHDADAEVTDETVAEWLKDRSWYVAEVNPTLPATRGANGRGGTPAPVKQEEPYADRLALHGFRK